MLTRSIFLLLFLVTAYGLLAQSDTSFVSLPRAEDSFTLPDGSKLRIHGSYDDMPRVELSGIFFESSLRFRIIPDAITEAYYVKNAVYGEVVVIESYFPSPSGLSANVVNLSFLLIKEGRIVQAEYANSFFGGVNDLQIKPDGIYVKALSFKEFTGKDEPVCCATDFKLGRDFKLRRIAKTTCVKYVSPRKLIPYTCDCEQAYFPVVMD